MLGQRSAQWGMFEADALYGDFVGRKNFYGFLASQRNELFRDEDFAALYCRDNGRPSVPPSLLATALVLQTYDRVSDDEATRRAAFDLQWKLALDTTHILGRGAVKDTYNLLADGIVQVLGVLAKLGPFELLDVAEEVGCARYVCGL